MQRLEWKALSFSIGLHVLAALMFVFTFPVPAPVPRPVLVFLGSILQSQDFTQSLSRTIVRIDRQKQIDFFRSTVKAPALSDFDKPAASIPGKKAFKVSPSAPTLKSSSKPSVSKEGPAETPYIPLRLYVK